MIKNITCSIAGIILVLILLEISSRYLGIFKPQAVPPTIGTCDTELGWSLRANSSTSSNASGKHVEYKINSKGLRDSEHRYNKANGTRRIVLLGDSHSFGVGIRIEDHFSSVLEQELKNTEVINLGVSGFGVDQMLLRFQRDGLPYQADVVLVYLPHFGNYRHMHFSRFGKQKPRFTLSKGKLRLENSPVICPPDKIMHALAWVSTHWQSLRLYRKAYDKSKRYLQGFSKKRVPQLVDTDSVEDLALQIVLQMQKEVQHAGAKLLVVSRISGLHDKLLQHEVNSLNVASQIVEGKYHLPNGLRHLNKEGNRVLALAIRDKIIQTNSDFQIQD